MSKGILTLITAATLVSCQSHNPHKTPNAQALQQIQTQQNINMKQQSIAIPTLPRFDRSSVNYRNIRPHNMPPQKNNPNLIQLALLLDTSNSMDGLINQAKSQLWSIVNELSNAYKNNRDIQFEVALFEYGNSDLKMSDGYIRMVQPLTSDLDQLSHELFSLETNGGSEYCGHVIASASNCLNWNTSSESLKLIYIAGNEAFTQGMVDYNEYCTQAASKSINVNTIFCGPFETGIETKWQHGAQLGNGSYFSINSDKKLEGIETPYDDELLELSTKLNATYIAYGANRNFYLNRQMAQDKNASGISKSIGAGRAASKGSKLYTNENWDLIDALKSNKLQLNNINQKELPENLQNKSLQDIRTFINVKEAERQQIQKQINNLGQKRGQFIKEKLQDLNKNGEETLDSAMIKSLKEQAKQKGFAFK
ncbi:MAG: VWA domain-containing protein [Lentisphaerales bacterium]|nr:VWA domain-containing protein [Lentisphaerales bacterium]